MDQRSVSFTTSFKTKKWTRKTLSFMLDTTRVNSQTIHSLKNDVHPRSSDSAAFAYNLGLSLISPHLEIRKSTNDLQSHVLDKITLFLPSERRKILVSKKGEEIYSHSKKGDNRRCRSCLNEARGEGEKRKKSSLGKILTQCQMCSEASCNSRSYLVCTECTKNLACETERTDEPTAELM